MFDWGVSAPRLTYTVWLVSLVYLGLQVVVTFLLYDSVGRYSTTAVATQLKYGHAIVAGGALPFGWRLADCCLRLKAPPPPCSAPAERLRGHDQVWRRRCMCFLGCRYQPQHAWVWDDVAHFFAALFHAGRLRIVMDISHAVLRCIHKQRTCHTPAIKHTCPHTQSNTCTHMNT